MGTVTAPNTATHTDTRTGRREATRATSPLPAGALFPLPRELAQAPGETPQREAPAAALPSLPQEGGEGHPRPPAPPGHHLHALLRQPRGGRPVADRVHLLQLLPAVIPGGVHEPIGAAESFLTRGAQGPVPSRRQSRGTGAHVIHVRAHTLSPAPQSPGGPAPNRVWAALAGTQPCSEDSRQPVTQSGGAHPALSVRGPGSACPPPDILSLHRPSGQSSAPRPLTGPSFLCRASLCLSSTAS